MVIFPGVYISQCKPIAGRTDQGYDLRQGPRLQLAELDEQRGVEDVDVRRAGQLEQLAKDHLWEREGGLAP